MLMANCMLCARAKQPMPGTTYDFRHQYVDAELIRELGDKNEFLVNTSNLLRGKKDNITLSTRVDVKKYLLEFVLGKLSPENLNHQLILIKRCSIIIIPIPPKPSEENMRKLEITIEAGDILTVNDYS